MRGKIVEPTIFQEYLTEADRLVAERWRKVAHQREVVLQLECAGRNSQEAQEALRQYEACLTLQVADRDRLHQHVGH